MDEKNQIDPQTLALLLNAAGGLYSATTRNRPKYDIPKSAREALQTARLLAADTQAPGESRNLDQINLGAANAVRAAQESGNVLEVLPAIYGESNKAKGEVFTRSEADQKRDIANLMRALGQYADYQDLEYQMNEFAPYAQRQQEIRDILGAAAQNAGALAEKNQVRSALGGDEGSSENFEMGQTINNNFGMSTPDEAEEVDNPEEERKEESVDYLPGRDVNVSEYYWQAPQKQGKVTSQEDQRELLLKLLQFHRQPTYYPY